MKLIVPEKLKDKLYYHDMTGAPEISIAYQMGWNDAIKSATETESLTVDAESVVRCKDCKHSDEYNHCAILSVWNKPDDYCSYGERMSKVNE